MTNGKKKGKKEEPVKLGMSFEDAIRLASNTAPLKEIDLNLNERTQIKGVSGRVIEFVCIHSPIPDKNRLTAFSISAEIEGDNVHGQPIPKNFVALTDPFSPEITVATFNINSEAKLPVNSKERLYITLRPPQNQKTEVESCTLLYRKHTNF